MKNPEANVERVDLEKGNLNEKVIVQGDYIQVHGDYINSPNSSDLTPKVPSKRTSIIFEIEGCLDDVEPIQLKELLKILRQLSQDGSVMMRDIEKGSIKITLDGSEEGIEKILELVQAGELSEIAGFSVINVRELTEKEKVTLKSKLIQLILDQNLERSVCELAFADLRGSDLREVNLRKADLRGINLSGADLSRVVNRITTNVKGFNSNHTEKKKSREKSVRARTVRSAVSLRRRRGADLSEANLSNANLSNANLSVTDLVRADLSEANLSMANLMGANLIDVNMSRSNLRGADLSVTNLRRANLDEANLSGANLSGANLSGANLRGADLSGANLGRADLIEANLRGADLSGANLENTIFGSNEGLSEEMKKDFIRRGAIFQDSPGSGARVLIRS